MSARIINGKEIARQLRQEISDGVSQLKRENNLTPGLAVILIGDNPASRSYVTAKEKACEEAGMRSFDYRLPENTTEQELLELIGQLNRRPEVHGILVQLPLPRQIRESTVLHAILPEKDVDGFHPVNVGKMCLGEPCFLPCTPHGIVQLLLRSGVKTDGADVVVVGRSNIVGKPLVNLLGSKSPAGNATVTLCHTHTKEIARFTRQADIVIAAAGRPGTITGDMIREGAVVIDVGVNRVPDASRERGYRLVGDVNFDECAAKASLITPVPGGVGPMTITMLLYNTLQAAREAAQRNG